MSGTGSADVETRDPDDRIAMLLSVIPGLGQVYLDHTVLGAVFFASCVTSVNMLFLGTQLQSLAHTDVLWWVGVVSLVTVWAGSIWHTYLQSYGTDRLRLAQSREVLLRAALVDYLRDELEASVEKLEQAIELDVDWQDPDPYFHLGVVSLRLAEKHAALKDNEAARTARRRSQWAFKTCLSRDLTNKWRAEIGRESKRMRKLLSVTGRLRSLTASGRMRALPGDSGSFPELRESNTWRRPGSMTMQKLREAKEGRDSGVLSELSAELEEVRRTPRTRRTSRKLKKKVLADPEDLPEPIVGGPQDETIDLTSADEAAALADKNAAEMLGGQDETIDLPPPERNRSDTQNFGARPLGATDEPVLEALPTSEAEAEGGMPRTRHYPRDKKYDKRPIPATRNSGLEQELAAAEAEELEGKDTKPVPEAARLRAEVAAEEAEAETERGLPQTRKENREELLERAEALAAQVRAGAAEAEAAEADEADEDDEADEAATENGPPDTAKQNQAALLARAEDLAAKVAAGEVEGGMPTTRVPEPKDPEALAKALAAAAPKAELDEDERERERERDEDEAERAAAAKAEESV